MPPMMLQELKTGVHGWTELLTSTVIFPVNLPGTKTMAIVRWTVYRASTQCKNP